MRGARGNSNGTRRTRAGTSCDPMRRTRKEIGRPTSADGIDTVTGTMPRMLLPSPCSDGGNAKPPRERGAGPSNFPSGCQPREALLPRVRAETEDPLLVSAILRSKTLDWVRRSPSDSGWAETMPLRWAGIFYESRVPGGRLSRKLSTRMANLISLCVEASGTVAFLRAGVTGIFRGSAMMAKMVQFGLSAKRPRYVQQVAQAYLDDLASSRCVGKQPVPLERLSEVARRNGTAEVNITLVELFSQEGTGTLMVLDPRFHPGMDPVAIRVVPPKTQDDAATYDLVHCSVQAAPG